MRRNLFLLACFLLAAGCGDSDGIDRYSVPKPVPRPYVRLVAAVLDDGPAQWYVKLLGREDLVAAQREAFDAFVKSLKPKGEKAEWTVPAGWKEVASPAKDGIKAEATFKAGDAAQPPLATVFRFGMKSPLLDNVNRWRRKDLGLSFLDEDGLKGVVQTVKAGDRDAAFVDMRGPGPGRARAADPHAGMDLKKPPAPRKGKPLSDEMSYAVPAGWTELGGRSGFVPTHSVIAVPDEAGAAEVKITKMAAFGDEKANLDRWRGEVGRGEVKTDRSTLDLPSGKAVSFDFAGDGKRSLVAVFQRPDAVWFVKLLGPSATVAKHKDAFESFVKSVQFKGAKR
ncbi:MAG: hypothetical protein K2W96_17800 [Gemmataceae bacterium]|nr:hypothetical protein [Gemmataceae bacterium]